MIVILVKDLPTSDEVKLAMRYILRCVLWVEHCSGKWQTGKKNFITLFTFVLMY